MRSQASCALVLAAALTGSLSLVGCRTADSAARSESGLNAETTAAAAADVRTIVTALRRHLRSGLGPVSAHYATDRRVNACWQNPAGNALNDWQKVLYCHYPLEFRLCLTPQLLLNRGPASPARTTAISNAYDACQRQVSEAFADGEEGFHYFFNNLVHPDTKSVFMSVYVENAATDLDAAAFMRDIGFTPVPGTFAVDVASISAELAAEVRQYPRFSGVLAGIPVALGRMGMARVQSAWQAFTERNEVRALQDVIASAL